MWRDVSQTNDGRNPRVLEIGNLKVADGVDIAILVKTKQFKTVGAIPYESKKFGPVQGMIINEIHPIEGEERKFLLTAFPKMDVDKILILDAGRAPTSAAAYLGLLAGELALVITGVGVLVVQNRQSTAESQPVQQREFTQV